MRDQDPGPPVDSEAVRMVRAAEQHRECVFGGWVEEFRPRGEQVVLLVDFENLVLGATSSVPGRADPVPPIALTWLCRAYGPTTIRRAYADWAQPRFGRHQQALERNGIDLVQIGHGPARKNGADIRMAVDAMETLIIHPAVDAFVLVTGDSDFSPLVAKLREFGKHVIGVGAETSASARLVSVCSEYKLWGSILARVDPDDPPPARSLDQARDLVARAFEALGCDTATAGGLKNRMLTLDPTFDEAVYGFTRFRDLLTAAGTVRIIGNSGGDITLQLTATPAGPPPADADADSGPAT